MFGLGFFEIVVIAIVALIFVKPKDLPGVFRKIGWIYRKAMRQIGEARKIIREVETGSIIDDENDGREEKVDERKNT